MTRQHPNAHDGDGHGEAEQFRGCEATATAQRHSIAVSTWTDDILTHGEEEERKRDGGNDCE